MKEVSQSEVQSSLSTAIPGPGHDSDRVILLRYHEVALKGANRGWFEDRMIKNIAKLVSRSTGREAPITREHGRMLLKVAPEPAVVEALERSFGLTGYSPARVVPTSLEALTAAAVDEFRAYVQKHGLPKSFRVQTKRSEKALPLSSMEIDREIGGTIRDAFPEAEVDLENPALNVGIEIRKGSSFITTEKLKGPGGLPVGTNARLLALLSGGLDSPIAAIKAIRRGSQMGFLHFYGAPFVGEEALHKVEDLARLVNRFQPEPQRLCVVPFGKIQERIALATNPKLRTVLYRRMMLRIACRIAERGKAKAIVTGESLGQVASQTVENLSTINSVATMPVIRPLITYDKDEIIDEARRLGTFDVSIRPAADCCTLFADRHPAIRSNPFIVEEQESKFPMEELIQEALDSAYFSART